jgi:hypothetical protein
VTKEPIPGERDPSTQTSTEPGIVGTTGYGGDLPADSNQDPTVSDEGRARNKWEGGGRTPDGSKDKP